MPSKPIAPLKAAHKNGMAKHFIDEKELKDPGSEANNVSRVVVDTHVELTEEEKQKAMEKAQQNYEKKLDAIINL